MRYSDEKIEAGRNFANKLWNASRFVLMNLGEGELHYSKEKLTIEDKWIINKSNKVIKEVTECLEKFDFGIALQKTIDFIRDEFCDWYIEMVKPRLYDMTNDTRDEALYTLNNTLKSALKLLHPFMPFITEEIYMSIKQIDESIMISDWPQFDKDINYDMEETDIETIKEIIKSVRNIRANMNVIPSRKTSIIFVTKEENIIKEGRGFIEKLAYADNIIIQNDKKDISSNAVSFAVPGIEIFIPFNDLVDIKQEIERLEKEILQYQNEINRVDKMLSNKGFTSKAPESKIKEEEEKRVKYKELLQKTEERLNQIK
jgi:valyl-tRNA synthetase